MLFKASQYTSWMLACQLAIEPLKPEWVNEPKFVRQNQEIEAELRNRGISDEEAEQMRAFAKRIADWLKQVVCMAEDDLEMGIQLQFSKGLIDKEERERMLAIVARYQ